MDILKEIELRNTVECWLKKTNYPGQMSMLDVSIVVNALDSTGWLKDRPTNNTVEDRQAKTDECKDDCNKCEFAGGCKDFGKNTPAT